MSMKKSKTILITGCAGLLGGRLCEYYKSEGWHVIGIDKGEVFDNVDDYYRVDFSYLFNAGELNIDFSDVDVVLNAVGYTHLDWIEDYSVEELSKMYNINVLGPYSIIREFIKSNLDTSDIKTICNIVSMGSNMAMRTSVGYCSTKAAFAMMTKQISREVSGKHPQFRVFGINPCGFGDGTDKIGGIIEDVLPQMLRTRPKQFPDMESAKKYNLQSPTGELLHVDDLVKFITFMIDFNNVHMNGSLLNFWDAGA